ncbi:hypothetical protein GCM10010503_40740 [Streptomyces lucensis JCM 4490]|uniref:Uncharacterized protein n=1 Tax=Streptomyces lucensis JCM 4490 TaxID=1306176 RepID=A0A918J864_9ACTN|nr:hypothetical protein GCM10010503_40740 [Streptomyces lucensis JCM 4490]
MRLTDSRQAQTVTAVLAQVGRMTLINCLTQSLVVRPAVRSRRAAAHTAGYPDAVPRTPAPASPCVHNHPK